MKDKGGPVRSRLKTIAADPAPNRAAAVATAALGAAGRACRRRPALVAGVLATLGCSGAVAYNALTQPGRHPAPLFGRSVPAVEPPRRAELAVAPLPVPRPDPVTTASTPTIEPPAVRPADPIGSLIRTGETKPAERSETNRVVAAQKALTRLGYGPLKADGQVGATTRGAIEQFERDQKLPPTGTLAPRTTRQLASMAGMPIE